MPDLFAATENSFKSKLRSAVKRLAASKILIGTSSWKYEGWCGQIYDEQRYPFQGNLVTSPHAALRAFEQLGTNSESESLALAKRNAVSVTQRLIRGATESALTRP